MTDYKQLPLPFPPEFISIPLSKRGKYAGMYESLVSAEDVDLAELNWQVLMTGNTQYAQRNYGSRKTRRTVMLHRVIAERMLERELTSDEDVDHINMNGLDNRRENLRVATRSQNKANTRKCSDNSSGYKGVWWDKRRNKFTAQIHVKGRCIHLGAYSNVEDAHKAYVEGAKFYFGEFANDGTK